MVKRRGDDDAGAAVLALVGLLIYFYLALATVSFSPNFEPTQAALP